MRSCSGSKNKKIRMLLAFENATNITEAERANETPLAPIPDPSLLVSLDDGSHASAKEHDFFLTWGKELQIHAERFFEKNINIVWRRGV